MKKPTIAAITFQAWCEVVKQEDWHTAISYEKHLVALGYRPMVGRDNTYTLVQERPFLTSRLPDRYHQAAHILRMSEKGHFTEFARVLDDVATCLYGRGRRVTLAWIDRQLPYYQEFNPLIARMLTNVKAHLIRNPRENGD